VSARYRLAIFDFDGTLADSLPWFLVAVNDAADRFGFRRIPEADMDTVRGYDPWQVMRYVRMPPWKTPAVVRFVRAHMRTNVEKIRLFDGIGPMLRALSDAGVRIAIVSTNSEENIRHVLGVELSTLVAHYGCGASLFGKKPLIRRALAAAGARADEAIYIGDEIRDLVASRGVGVAFGAVSWGFSTPAALEARRPELVFRTVAQIETLAG
jgi:phosphoglycolate phosphatase